ncbi:MAG: DUF86 domain-containing protein [Syntrophomonadaceae bacterium]|jgi:uncharacterized protein YutE (UPF0331/DUF86 family)|nr:DUF86 domain-containing protein [Syntrophomonadaceae bacterium]
MVNKDLLVTRLDKLKGYVDFLESVKTHDQDRFVKDPYIHGAGERFLHLAIESVIDISNHIISDLRYRKPESNRDIFAVLYENEVIPFDLKDSLSNMASFRNILVHDYIKLDRALVYGFIKNHLDDFRVFARIISDLL